MILGRKIIACIFLISLLFGFKLKPDSPSDNTWIKTIIERLEVPDCFWALDYEGNLCITGYFMNTIHVDSVKLVSVGNFDIFLAKYSKEGKLLWVKQAGGSDPDFVRLIKLDNNNNIFITGYFTGISFFEDYIAYSKGKRDVYTAKYGSDGELQWVKSQGAEIICESNPTKRKLIALKLKNR